MNIGDIFDRLWAAPDSWRVGVAYGVASLLLLLGAVRAVVELHGTRRGSGGGDSDADALARLTRVPGVVCPAWRARRGVPGVVWVALFWLVTVACAAAGAWFMVGEVVGG